MCGIVGIVANKDVATNLLEVLKRLEYRGYDSAGVVVIDAAQHFERHRVCGKVDELQQVLQREPLHGTIGLAHTRWATHGKPSELNAHPHIAGDTVAVVHNGIIENHEVLRARLLSEGALIQSETDSELVAQLVASYIRQGLDFLKAVRHAANELEGAFAVGLLSLTEPDKIIAMRRGSPLVIGFGKDENYIASEHLALLPLTQRFIYLKDGDIADVQRTSVTIYNETGTQVERPIHVSNIHQEAVTKGKYRHFMQKEIAEQPDAIRAALEGRLTAHSVLAESFGPEAPAIFSKVRRVQIVACGTSFHAGLVGRYWLEALAHVPCQVEIASEYRYRTKVIEPDTLFVTLSQSGETADTLAALRLAKESGYLATLTICNVPESSLVRESDLCLMMRSGPEIGVASTKAFTSQLVSLVLLTICLGQYHGLDQPVIADLVKALRRLPSQIQEALHLDHAIKKIAAHIADKSHVLFLGRGMEYPIALEGALKLKEISYIHAEAYPAGELKHGPIALVDGTIPVIVLAPTDELLEKLKSNLQEVHARDANLIVFTDDKSGINADPHTKVLIMPGEGKLAPIVYVIGLQLLAYHVAVIRGTDIDQPRNLAKSVTVE